MAKIGDHVDALTWGATTVAKKERNGGGDGSGGNFDGSGGVKASHKEVAIAVILCVL